MRFVERMKKYLSPLLKYTFLYLLPMCVLVITINSFSLDNKVSSPLKKELSEYGNELRIILIKSINQGPSGHQAVINLQTRVSQLKASTDLKKIGKEDFKKATQEFERILADSHALFIDSKQDMKQTKTHIDLLTDLSKLNQKIEKLDSSTDLTHSVKQAIKWVGSSNFFIVLFGVGIIYFLSNKELRNEILGRNYKWSLDVFGFKLEPGQIDKDRFLLKEQYKQIERLIGVQYVTVAKASNIKSSSRSLYVKIRSLLDDLHIPQPTRVTFYVPSYLSESLVQITQYYGPKQFYSEKQIGRQFSIRYGIIGKAWRLQTHLINSNVSNVSNELVKAWGLTLQEARAQGTGKNSLIAFPISVTHKVDINNADEQTNFLGLAYIEWQDVDQSSASKFEKFKNENFESFMTSIKNSIEYQSLAQEFEELHENLKWDDELKV